MKLIFVILATFAGIAFADKPKVIVNGQDLTDDAMVINGRTYVPVDLLKAPPAVPLTITEPARAPISGQLTWNGGITKANLPDAGARIWLLTAAEVTGLIAETKGTPNEPLPDSATNFVPKLDASFPHTTADGIGRFAFTNVVPGSYTLIFLSKRANGLAARDRAGKVRCKTITVEAGQPVDASFNFGVTAYR